MKSRPNWIFPILLIALNLSGCSGLTPKSQTQGPAVIHIVLCWLENPNNRDHQQRIIERTQTFSHMSGLLDLQVGTSVPSDRGLVDDSFDVGVYLRFNSVESMNLYLVDPIHVRAVQEVFKPLCRKIRAHDFYQS